MSKLQTFKLTQVDHLSEDGGVCIVGTGVIFPDGCVVVKSTDYSEKVRVLKSEEELRDLVECNDGVTLTMLDVVNLDSSIKKSTKAKKVILRRTSKESVSSKGRTLLDYPDRGGEVGPRGRDLVRVSLPTSEKEKKKSDSKRKKPLRKEESERT